jgi:2-haloacid dehalogenase
VRRLKDRFIVAPNSNGHIALITSMAKRAGLPWDAVLGAEIARAYKPSPEEYQRNVAALDLEPADVMMVAAHNYDLIGARSCGLKTAFVLRATEFGPKQASNLKPERGYDVIASDFVDLARQMGC